VLGFEPMTYGPENECATHYTTAPHLAISALLIRTYYHYHITIALLTNSTVS